jgi:hypothetical protein
MVRAPVLKMLFATFKKPRDFDSKWRAVHGDNPGNNL